MSSTSRRRALLGASPVPRLTAAATTRARCAPALARGRHRDGGPTAEAAASGDRASSGSERCPERRAGRGACRASRRELGQRRAAGRRGRVLALRQRARPGAVGGRRCRAADRARRRRAGRSPSLVPSIAPRGRPWRWRSRSGRCPTGSSARPRSSSARRSATCSPGCGCSPTRPTPPPSSARSPGRRSSCARSTSPAAPRSRADASSTWSRRSPPRPSRRRSRPRRASGSACSSSSTARRMRALDTTRPDLYVHRLIERLGLRRQQLFAAQADVVERLRALARFGELAVRLRRAARRRRPRGSSPGSIAAVADCGAARARSRAGASPRRPRVQV